MPIDRCGGDGSGASLLAQHNLTPAPFSNKSLELSLAGDNLCLKGREEAVLNPDSSPRPFPFWDCLPSRQAKAVSRQPSAWVVPRLFLNSRSGPEGT